MKRRIPLFGGVALLASLVLVASPAAAAPAAPPPPSETLRDGLVSPLKLALDFDGSVFLTENFAGHLDRRDRGGEFATLYSAAPGTEIGAVSVFAGTTYFTERIGDQSSVSASIINKRDRRGNVTRAADLLAYEQQNNPDGDQQYGFTDLDPACAAQLPPEVPAEYTGVIDTHAYATLSSPLGTLVADAGANAILSIDRRGTVRTTAVLPPQPVVLGEWALSLGLPECTIGEEYAFEPVPTDVELGPRGALYVTLLPGGPEDPSAGARGSVVKVNPWNGTVETVATGFSGATDLAVSPRGDIYVAELFGGRISVIERGSSEPVLWREANLPAAVEWSPRGLYATTDVLGDEGAPPAGKLVFFPF